MFIYFTSLAVGLQCTSMYELTKMYDNHSIVHHGNPALPCILNLSRTWMERLLVTSLSRMTQAPCKHQVHEVFCKPFQFLDSFWARWSTNPSRSSKQPRQAKALCKAVALAKSVSFPAQNSASASVPRFCLAMEGRAAFSEALKETHGLSEVPVVEFRDQRSTIYQPAINIQQLSSLSTSLNIFEVFTMYIYIYTYIYACICVYLYIYIYDYIYNTIYTINHRYLNMFQYCHILNVQVGSISAGLSIFARLNVRQSFRSSAASTDPSGQQCMKDGKKT